MKKKDLPAMPFYVGDWLKCPEVRSLNFELRGIWFEMLCYMWESTERGYLVNPSGCPYTTEDLSCMLGVPKDLLEQKLEQMRSKGVFSARESDSAIYSRKMVRDDEIRQIRAECGKKGGKVSFARNFAQAKHGAKVKQNTETEYEKAHEFENEACINNTICNSNTNMYIDINTAEVFEELWKKYPKKVEKKKALSEFKKSVKNKSDVEDIKKALKNYLEMLRVEDWRKPKDACRWFKDDFWRSFIDQQNISNKSEADIILEKYKKGNEL